MSSEVEDPAQRAALDKINEGLAELRAAGLSPAGARDAVTLIRETACITQQARAVEVAVMDDVDRRALHRPDAHASAKVMVRHCAKLSEADARRRAQSTRVLRQMPTVQAGFSAGRIGIEQVERIARAYANRRIREALVRHEEEVAALAESVSYLGFDQQLSAWCRLMDQDGTADRSRATHENRDCRFSQDYDLGWSGKTRCGTIEGAEVHDILTRFEDLEWQADWAEARAEFGDEAVEGNLRRTPGQRRWDAYLKMCRLAADAHESSPGGSRIETVIVIGQTAFEDQLAVLTGAERVQPDVALYPIDQEEARAHRCSTIDGHGIDPAEATHAALLGHVRRAVFSAKSVVIDLGRRIRLFTGPAALALKLGSTTCSFAGCELPASLCQGGHLKPFADRGGGDGGGRTDQDNGGPECGRQNRLKDELGLTTERADDGTWHTYRADGTEI
jgi:hypothetical protein